MNLRVVRNILIILCCIVISFSLGYRQGSIKSQDRESDEKRISVSGKDPINSLSVDFSLFWDVWDRLNRYYIDKKNLDPQKMVYGAITGMVASLEDPYTVFLLPDQNKDAKDDLGGIFEGIGAQLGVKDKKIVVISPLKSSPAEKAGIKPGDWIIKVDDQFTTNWTLPQAVTKIRGAKGTKVMLTLIHKDASASSEIAVQRDEIKVASVEWEIKKFQITNDKLQMKDKNESCENCQQAVYLRLGRFGDQTTDEWTKAVDEINATLQQNNNTPIKGLILDVRNNPGGYLSGSVFIGSEFLKDGTVVIQEAAGGVQKKYEVNRKGKLINIPLVVLINKGSASASEIVAGALKDRGRAKLIGETTFGKGTIQDAQELPAGAGIHITTSKWLLPSGKWINGNGIDPDVKVETEEETGDTDRQLEEAAGVLLK